MSQVEVGDLKIYYEIAGRGQPLVLLPGLLGTIESDWRRFIPALAKNFKTIAVDLRGHGRTDHPDPLGNEEPGELDLNRMGEDLKGLLDHLGLESVCLLGYSLGGCIGLKAGLKEPGRIKVLAMHATKFFWNETSISSMVAGMAPAIILEKNQRYAQALQNNHSGVYGNDYWKVLLRSAARFVKTMPETAPTIEEAARADFSILVSVGDHDHLVSIDEAARLYRALPKGELLVLPSTRHAINSVRVEPFTAMVAEFIQRNSGNIRST